MFLFYILLVIVALFTLTNIKKSTLSKKYKFIIYTMLAIYFIGPYYDNIIFGARNLYGLVSTTYITPDKEFILFKCKSESHKKEKVYMSINDIYKDKDSDLILDVNLRYDGKESLNLYGNNGFAELSGFYAEAVSLEDRANSKGFYIGIGDELLTKYNPHIKNLNSKISNGGIINIKAPILISDSKLKEFNIDDLKFKIEKSYSGTHHGVGSFKYVKCEK